MARLHFVLIFALLAACTPRGVLLVDPTAASVGTVQTVFVGTTRSPDPQTRFGALRSSELRFLKYAISLPPSHETGQIEWPRAHAPADAATDFVATSEQLYSNQREFTTDLARAIRALPRGERIVTIYVHGFNNTFADGVYRLAQMSKDFGIADVAVHYSWPSGGHPLGYAYDRDSVLFARDGLEQLIKAVDSAGADSVMLVGHSMGGLLAMESMRQMAIASPRSIHKTIDSVILISPDIDVEVFRRQAERIGDLPDPFLIFASDRDRALGLSARLTGQRERLGTLTDIDTVADLDVTIIDVTEFTKSGLGHFDTATSPELVSILSRLRGVITSFSNDPTAQAGLFPGTVLIVQNATEIILSPLIQ